MVREEHGWWGTPTYWSWVGMKQRCNNPKGIAYKNYGGRGIKVCPEWEGSFGAFLRDMGEKPEGYSLDRINSDGDYTPDNCRWADRFTQASNQRRAPTKSGKVGVTKHHKVDMWEARITRKGQLYYLGLYKDLDEAVSTREAAEEELNRE